MKPEAVHGTVRIGLCQFGAQLADVAANAARIAALLVEAARGGASLACLPELCLTGYLLDGAAYTDRLLDEAEAAERELAARGRELGVTVVYGTVLRAPAGLSNAIVLQPPGGPRTVYRKTHMDPRERAVFTPGDALVVTGGIGLACCYDLAFPEQPRLLALQGARLLLAPMAWEEQRGFVMDAVVPARATENIAYLVCVNQCGVRGPYRFRGASCVTDPLGARVATLGNEEGVALCDADLDWVERLRDRRDERTYPLFADRRPSLYDPIAGEAAP